MKRIFAKLILLGAIAWAAASPSQADWRTPTMAEYVKVPVFATNAARPNILIARWTIPAV